MKIRVTAKPGAKAERVEEAEAGENANLFLPHVRREMPHVIVRVTEPARDGKANEAIRRALARHLNVAVSRVRLVSGAASREKLFDII
jgi:uncharacterized protein YggU (UPF0235/DUF167 family)